MDMASCCKTARLSKLYVHCGCTSSDQNIDLRKVRTENVKIRTDPQDRVMDGWSVAQ